MGKTLWTGLCTQTPAPHNHAMPIARRAALGAILATPALANTHERRLVPLPGRAPITVSAALDGQVFTVRLGDAPFQFPSWYGQARIETRLRAAGRDLILVGFEGQRGTGVSQRLAAVLGFDDAGQARVLGIETLRSHDAGDPRAIRETTGRLEAAQDGLRLSIRNRFRQATAEWRTPLTWSGAGVLAAPASPPGASEPQRRMDAARAALAPWLALAPRTDLRAAPFDETGLYNVGLSVPP